jgi:hypothetical protein
LIAKTTLSSLPYASACNIKRKEKQEDERTQLVALRKKITKEQKKR